MANELCEVENVTRDYKQGDINLRAIDGINFELDEGKLSVIIGPSGAGKSTVLNILGGMDMATSGIVTVGGRDITSLSRRQRTAYRRDDIGFIFQFYNLIQNLTALENVELASHIRSQASDPTTILTQVGLEDRINNFPSQLSGGEQQRVAIARALAKKPKLLLCDEPTGALDYETGKGILRLLQDASKDGMTVVVITHNSAITPMADRIVKIKSGKVESVRDNPNPKPVSEIEW
ncbi:MAG: ABC transporter ATP-binding protein [Defluviitaleaceae bacterium]|nr:ABC transporter ATP-binding protein [Defluviitaleaceae bacterium]